MKADWILQNILLHKEFKRPENIKELDIREEYIFNLIRRYIRYFKGTIPYTHKSTSFMIDADMYGYESRDGQLFLLIQFQADFNASCNIKSRKDIGEISLYTPYKQVKEIMIKKTKSA